MSSDPAEVISIVETIGEDPETRRLWEELRKREATRLSSLLGLSRTEKYRTSLERVTEALLGVGLNAEGMGRFLDHVCFSWLVGNGDLHAKNLSVLHEIQPGRFGSPPAAVGVRYSPLYDLVNTRLVLPGDLFALPLNGKENNLRLRDFETLAARWGSSRVAVRERVTDLADRILAHVDEVLETASLGEEIAESYRRIVVENVRGL